MEMKFVTIEVPVTKTIEISKVELRKQKLKYLPFLLVSLVAYLFILWMVTTPPAEKVATTPEVRTQTKIGPLLVEKLNYDEPELIPFVEEIDEVEEATTWYTPEELEALAIIIYQEAGGNKYTDLERIYVGCVVLNRVESSKFPNTIEEVATQKGQWGTIYWRGITWPDRATKPEEANAVERAWRCAKEVLEMETRPMPTNVIWCAEFKQGTGTWYETDGIYFCY